MKKIFKEIVRIIIGFVLSLFVFVFINFLIGNTVYYLVEANVISMQESADLFKTFFIMYLPFIVVFIIIGVMIFRNYTRGEKREILWKLIVLILSLMYFEYGGPYYRKLLSKLIELFT